MKDDAPRRRPCALYVRVKMLREVNPLTSSFTLRWRYFVYIYDSIAQRSDEDGTPVVWPPPSDEAEGEAAAVLEEVLDLEMSEKPDDLLRLKSEIDWQAMKRDKEVRWYVKELKHRKPDPIDVSTFMPLPTIANRLNKLTVTSDPEIIYKRLNNDKTDEGNDDNSAGDKYYAWCYTEQVEATLSHEFDLLQFPFDKHFLELDYRINKVPFRNKYFLKVAGDLRGDETRADGDDGTLVDDIEKIPYYYKNKRPPCIDAAEGLVAALEFDPHLTCGPEFDLGMPTQVFTKEGRDDKPRLVFKIQLTRKSTYYTRSILAVESLIATIAFALVVIHPRDFNNRLATGVTVLFTTVSFSTSVASNLPKLPYETFLSWHAFACISLVIILIVVNICIFQSHAKRRVDRTVYSLLGVAWVAYHFSLYLRGRQLIDFSPHYIPLPRPGEEEEQGKKITSK